MSQRATAASLAVRVAAEESSPLELVRETLDAIERWQPVTNAFSQVWAGEATATARWCELLVAGGEYVGPLHGVPVAVKDLFDVNGHETTGCSDAYKGNVATTDAELVRRMRAAGAIVVGKTNQHELAMGGTNLVSACGPTHNPWDPARITGGSSGGSAAAVAAGVVPLALGTDTGGSIRNPAVLCGCWGLKPTQGRLPAGGAMPLAPSLDCPGPIAGTAGDLALVWEVLAGVAFPAELSQVRRVGILGGHFAERVHPDIRAAVEATAAALESLGAELVPVDGEGIADAVPVWLDLVCAEMVQAHAVLADRREELQPVTAGFFAHGINLTDEQRRAAYRRTGEVAAWFSQRLRDVDLLLAPSSPYPAPLSDEEEVDVGGGETVDVQLGGTSIFTRLVSLAGLPALAVPAGLSPAGLPVGAQLIARPKGDELLIGIARGLEGQDERFRPGLPPVPA